MTDVIRFPAVIYKIQTVTDGGIRVTLDMPETQIETARLLMECKSRGGLLEIAAIPIDNVEKQKGNNAISEGTIRKSAWATQEGPRPNGDS